MSIKIKYNHSRLTKNINQPSISIIAPSRWMSEEILKSLGQDRISTKGEQGMGIGLLLANATLERLGGEINFLSREGGGVIARVVLPIHHSI